MLSNIDIENRLLNGEKKGVCRCKLCGGNCLTCPKCKGGNIINKIISKIPSSDDTARPRYPGELHAILKLPNGKFGIANYMGPGTHVVERIKRGDPPRTYTDKIAQAHDIRYGLAKSQDEVSAADRKFISSIKAAQGKDSNFNIQLGLRPIQAKLFAEEKGIIKPGKIASFGDIPPEDIPVVKSKLRELESQGLGKGGCASCGAIQKKNLDDLSENVKKAKQTISKDPKKSSIFGSYVYRGQTYPSDIDIHEVLESNISKEDAYNKMANALKTLVRRIQNQKGSYVGDIKAGIDERFILDPNDEKFGSIIEDWYNNGLIDKKEMNLLEQLYVNHDINLLEEELRQLQVIRWKADEVLQGYKILPGNKRINLVDAMKGKSAIKIDMWTPINGDYNEVTNFFFVIYRHPDGTFELLNAETKDYLREMVKQIEKFHEKEFYNPFKAAKRMWGIARFTKNDELLNKLTPLFQGDMARINQVMSEISTIILMMENIKNLPIQTLRAQIDRFKDRLAYVYRVPIDDNYVSKLISNIVSHFANYNQKTIIAKLKELKDYLEKLRNEGTEEYLNKHRITSRDIEYIKNIPENKQLEPFILKALHMNDKEFI